MFFRPFYHPVRRLRRCLMAFALVTAITACGGCGLHSNAGGLGAAAGPPGRVPEADSCHARGPLPDRHCTPGLADRRVTQGNIAHTICRPGYSRSVRPPVSYTEPLKKRLMRSYGLEGRPLRDFELDHLISLEIGGSPTDPRNLWPEAHAPSPGSFTKDDEENELHRKVCSGQLTLRRAQDEEARNWLAAWRRDRPPHGFQ